MNPVEKYCFGLIDFAELIREYGAKAIWEDLKNSYPEEYRELLFYALEELPK